MGILGIPTGKVPTNPPIYPHPWPWVWYPPWVWVWVSPQTPMGIPTLLPNWDRSFNLALCWAREKSWGSADWCFKECETHTHISHCFIRALRQLVQELFRGRGSQDKLCDTFLQVFDLLIAVVSEVKLHKYAPSNPLSKCLDICMYTVV